MNSFVSNGIKLWLTFLSQHLQIYADVCFSFLSMCLTCVTLYSMVTRYFVVRDIVHKKPTINTMYLFWTLMFPRSCLFLKKIIYLILTSFAGFVAGLASILCIITFLDPFDEINSI